MEDVHLSSQYFHLVCQVGVFVLQLLVSNFQLSDLLFHLFVLSKHTFLVWEWLSSP